MKLNTKNPTARDQNATAQDVNYTDLDQADRDAVDNAVRKGYSRREMLKLVMATGVTAATAHHLFSEGGIARAQTPKKGGSVIMSSNLHGPDDQLDPMLFTSTIDYTRGRATYNGLCQHANDLTPQPELASEWTSNRNATEWTFKLRKGVRFHDGSRMTADDVVWSMNRHLTEDSTSTVKPVLSTIKEWRKTGRYEVKAIMHSPNADLPIILGIFQTKIVRDGSTGEGIGTGPFKMEAFQPGVKSVHVRNDNYWRDGPNLDAVEITAITDPVSRLNALLSGSVQMITEIEPKSFRQVRATDSVRLLSTPAAKQLSICVLKNTAPGKSDDFVKAMQYIQDRESIVRRALKGEGTAGNDMPVSSAHGPDFCSELPQRAYDPDKAKYHLKRAKVKSAELYVAPVTVGMEDTCLIMQANLAKIGFKLKLNRVPTDGYWGAVWLKEPMNVVTWNMRPTAQSQMAIQFAPGAAWNDTYWNNDRMGKLLNEVLSVTDQNKRHEMMCEMQTLIHNNSGIVTPAFPNIIDGVAENVFGVPTVPTGQLGGNEWPEFIWLA